MGSFLKFSGGSVGDGSSGSLLWRGFKPWPRSFHVPWAWPKKKKYKCDFLQFVREPPAMWTGPRLSLKKSRNSSKGKTIRLNSSQWKRYVGTYWSGMAFMMDACNCHHLGQVLGHHNQSWQPTCRAKCSLQLWREFPLMSFLSECKVLFCCR